MDGYNQAVKTFKLHVALILAGAVLAGVTGCASTNNHKISVLKTEIPSPPKRLDLSPGDVIDVKFFYNSELDETQTIRPDGKISLQLVGEVQAEGKTPTELQYVLNRLFSLLLDKPEVSVIIRSLESRVVFVGGAVNRPGRIKMPGRLTALGAVMEAGSFNQRAAQLANVIVIRQSATKPEAFKIDLRDALGGKLHQPFYLQPMDVVYVPQKKIVNMNHAIDLYINQMVPQFGFTYFRTSENGRNRLGIDTSR